MTPPPDTARLAFDEVEVRFGPVTVLSEISVEFGAGEIIGLLGHNGAGKSTLINVATGALRSYGGRIVVDGTPLAAGSTPKSIAAEGVAVIHQEPALAPNLSVLDNLHLARDSAKTGRKERQAAARAALDSLGAEQIALDQPVETLSLGERQMVDLARSVMLGDIKVLFLDEPTAALGEAETRSLHEIIRRLAAQGTTIVYVSHRLPDIIDVCTRIVALREGRLTLDAPVGSFTNESLSAALAGDKSLLDDEVRQPVTGPVLLSVSHEVELEFRPGEIVGLFGMAAGTQFGVLQTLYGIGATRGAARLRESAIAVSGPRGAIRQGVHLVPGDRERDGLVAGMSAFDNVFLPWLHDSKLSSKRTREQLYDSLREALAIQGPDGRAPISTFSGGNRQKHLLARWIFPKRPAVLLLEQPTQGVDVGAKADIRRCLREVAAEGTTIVVASAETDEIASLCDRAYVLSGSRSRSVAKSPQFQSELLSTLFDITAR
ncbi:sugar ABC transporter ATP-binding protein [Herbiconiux sp. KACC 21604]|uniref:ATP-binding cassette domain-containing protein n=1 Tax=unclassified Herbiconiux TaxID=2618217 RepID=UPI0014928E63|nr:sugar ABC transporter ATP-binding protein [Herbiconiux sp. SALV-R1]QJU53463.1 sugar ABC transporter ATP-binding protein [Herbiconiux sp. SALV-R1]WPO88435.1 sugar ABC transporter ATP-binding protein [Herbiconiux sp. KACC 21604]